MSCFLSSLRPLLPLLLPAAVAAQAPAISSLSPGSGPLGTTVTLGGSNLGGATSVLVGGVPAAFAPAAPRSSPLPCRAKP